MTDRAAARRAAVRQHHPDVGGSAAALTQALDAIERDYRRPGDSVPITIIHRSAADKARALLIGVPTRILKHLNAVRRSRFTHLKDHS